MPIKTTPHIADSLTYLPIVHLSVTAIAISDTGQYIIKNMRHHFSILGL